MDRWMDGWRERDRERERGREKERERGRTEQDRKAKSDLTAAVQVSGVHKVYEP